MLQLALPLRHSTTIPIAAHCTPDGCVYVSQHLVTIQIQSAAANLRRCVYLPRAQLRRSRSKPSGRRCDLDLGGSMGSCLLEGSRLRFDRTDLCAAAFQTKLDLESAHFDVDSLLLSFRNIALPLSFGSLRLSKIRDRSDNLLSLDLPQCFQRADNFRERVATYRAGLKPAPTFGQAFQTRPVFRDENAKGRLETYPYGVHP